MAATKAAVAAPAATSVMPSRALPPQVILPVSDASSVAPTPTAAGMDEAATYSVRLRYGGEVRAFLIAPAQSEDEVLMLSRCIAASFPKLVSSSMNSTKSLRVTGVISDGGVVSPLYVLATTPQLFTGLPFSVLALGDREVVQSNTVKVLPAGWEQRAAPGGRTYYINHNTKKTSWRDPRIPNPLAEDPKEAAAPTYQSVMSVRDLARETKFNELEVDAMLDIFRAEATVRPVGAGKGAAAASAAGVGGDMANASFETESEDMTETGDDSHDIELKHGRRDAKRQRFESARAGADSLAAGGGGGGASSGLMLDRVGFQRCMDRVLSRDLPADDRAKAMALSERLFAVFDKDKSGTVEWSEFVLGLSLLCRGPAEGKVGALFRILDTDGSGTISQAELLSYFMVTRDLFVGSSGISPVGHDDHEVREQVAACFAIADANQDGAISLEEFTVWARTNPPCLRWISMWDKVETKQDEPKRGGCAVM